MDMHTQTQTHTVCGCASESTSISIAWINFSTLAQSVSVHILFIIFCSTRAKKLFFFTSWKMHFGSRKFPRKQTQESVNGIHFFSLPARLTVALCSLSIFSLNHVFPSIYIYMRDKFTRKQPLIAIRCVVCTWTNV